MVITWEIFVTCFRNKKSNRHFFSFRCARAPFQRYRAPLQRYRAPVGGSRPTGLELLPSSLFGNNMPTWTGDNISTEYSRMSVSNSIYFRIYFWHQR